MKSIILIVFLLILKINFITTKSKFLKVETCETSNKSANIIQCELINDKFNLVFDVLEPIKNHLKVMLDIRMKQWPAWGRLLNLSVHAYSSVPYGICKFL